MFITRVTKSIIGSKPVSGGKTQASGMCCPHFRVVQMVWMPQAAASKQQNGKKLIFLHLINFE